jgi:hypothetical protein
MPGVEFSFFTDSACSAVGSCQEDPQCPVYKTKCQSGAQEAQVEQLRLRQQLAELTLKVREAEIAEHMAKANTVVEALMVAIARLDSKEVERTKSEVVRLVARGLACKEK